MKQYAITFMEDVATANGRNPDPTEFIAEAKLRGKVVDFDEAVKEIRAECQRTIDNLAKQLNAIKDQELTPDEIVLLNTYRDCKAATGEAYLKRIEGLEKCLEDVRVASQKRAAQIAQLVAELQEANA